MKAMKIGTVVAVLVVLAAMPAVALDRDDALYVEPNEVVCDAFAAEGISADCMAKASADLTAAERCCWHEIMEDVDTRGALNGIVNEMLWEALNVAVDAGGDVEEAYTVVAGRVWVVGLPD